MGTRVIIPNSDFATYGININVKLSGISISVSSGASKLYDTDSDTSLVCTAKYSDGTSKTVTPTWAVTSGDTYASISNKGVLSISAAGSVTVSATYGGKTATKTISVYLNKVTALAINGDSTVTDSGSFTATATFLDGSSKTVYPAWSVSDEDYATINGDGVLTVITAGTISVVAAYTDDYGNTKSGNKIVKVALSDYVTGSVTVSKTDEGKNYITYTAEAEQTNDSGDTKTVDVTSTATWTISSGSSYATINKGVLTITGSGTVKLYATYGGVKSNETTVTVTYVEDVTLSSVSISGSSSVTDSGTYTATATYSDGSTKDVTSTATWKSSDTSVATVSKGTLTAVSDGTVTITATYDGKSATKSVSVSVSSTETTITDIVLTCDTEEIEPEDTAEFRLKVHYSDGSTSTTLSGVVWSLSTDIDAASSGKGTDDEGDWFSVDSDNISGKTGYVTVTAASSDGSAKGSLTVSALSYVSMYIEPSSSTIYNNDEETQGEGVNLVAHLVKSNDEEDTGKAVTWSNDLNGTQFGGQFAFDVQSDHSVYIENDLENNDGDQTMTVTATYTSGDMTLTATATVNMTVAADGVYDTDLMNASAKYVKSAFTNLPTNSIIAFWRPDNYSSSTVGNIKVLTSDEELESECSTYKLHRAKIGWRIADMGDVNMIKFSFTNYSPLVKAGLVSYTMRSLVNAFNEPTTSGTTTSLTDTGWKTAAFEVEMESFPETAEAILINGGVSSDKTIAADDLKSWFSGIVVTTWKRTIESVTLSADSTTVESGEDLEIYAAIMFSDGTTATQSTFGGTLTWALKYSETLEEPNALYMSGNTIYNQLTDYSSYIDATVTATFTYAGKTVDKSLSITAVGSGGGE